MMKSASSVTLDSLARVQVQQNLLDLHELLEPRATALPAEAALLDPAERLVGCHREHAVDRDAARFEPGGDIFRARQVRSEERRVGNEWVSRSRSRMSPYN